MARAAEEGRALRRQTAAFIATDPIAISVSRVARLSDGAGGWIDNQVTTLPPQIVKLQPITAMGAREASSAAGSVTRTTHQVVGMPDLDLKVDDVFEWKGAKWEVKFLDNSQEYRTAAEVIRREQD